MEIRSTLRRVTWPEKRLKEKRERRKRRNERREWNEQEREREKPGFTRLPNVSLPRSEPRKTGRLRSICIFFFPFFFFFDNASRKQTATTAPFQPVNRLFFHDGGAEKPSNDHVKRKQLSCARASRRIMRIISRENSLIRRRGTNWRMV